MKAGTVVTLRVAREVPFGFFLTDGEEDVLLHRTEATDEIEIEQELEVFLYQDHEGRLSASLTIPTVQIDHYDWVEVVEVKKNLGVFVNIGLKKDILVSMDDLPAIFSLWPTIGDKLYCSLKVDNKNRLYGKLGTEEVMRSLAIPAEPQVFNKNVKGTVYRLLLAGSFIITEEGYMGFIHESERKEEPRLGQEVEGRIIDVKEDGTINISLLPRTHELINDDASIIYEYLQGRGGSMPYWDKSLPEDIKRRFNMSKGSFKKALGKLMKENKIVQEDGWTHIKDQEK
ncbi:S1 RNA-binding domain-containing protein [Lederbergia wuyishanensis]|uniref:RNA-binding protein (Virulence factor B family) n=1 Tax=Lederbergia wuyishanensis TaxID=1347903 RepID=A0ABU0CZB9_9BACI|nr:S1 RNA-binding domain-containing protein [Lederbergia wuyishanensis]MCJ8006106.1 S1 RNA-binding domain-containing protein [Lederbergia wuyishanensis]MDQ0341475.1 putative RNA-binding protein (virulence factor B family) [Lederbergia wuyishanensis]